MNLFDSLKVIEITEQTGCDPTTEVTGSFWCLQWSPKTGDTWRLYPGEHHISCGSRKRSTHYHYDKDDRLRRIVRNLGSKIISEYFDANGQRITYQEYLNGK